MFSRRKFFGLFGGAAVAAAVAPELLKASPLATGGPMLNKGSAWITGERGPEMIISRSEYARALQIPADRLFDADPEVAAKIAQRLAKLEKALPRIVKERRS